MANEPVEAKNAIVGRASKRRKRLAASKQESPKTGYLGFRLPEEEFKAIEDAAAAAGESVSEYVRKAAAMRIDRNVRFVPEASFYYASSTMTVVDNKSAISEVPRTVPLNFSSSPAQSTSE